MLPYASVARLRSKWRLLQFISQAPCTDTVAVRLARNNPAEQFIDYGTD